MTIPTSTFAERMASTLRVVIICALAVGCAPLPEDSSEEQTTIVSPSDGLFIRADDRVAVLTRDCNNNGIMDFSEVRSAMFAMEAPATYVTGDYARGIAQGDFNADGHQDLAVTNYDADLVNILINDGDGAFHVHASAPEVGNGPIAIASADLDADGDDDLAVANHIDGSLSILRSNGDGTFVAAVTYGDDLPVEFRLIDRVLTSDLDGDGAWEIAIKRQIASQRDIVVLWNSGHGTFDAHTLYELATAVDFADLDGDGDDDMLLGYSDGDVVAYQNLGARVLDRSATRYELGALLLAGDLTGDGRPEVITGADPLRVWQRGDPWWDHTGAFTEIANVETGLSIVTPYNIAITDLDNDALQDVVVLVTGEAHALLNKGLGRFEAPRQLDPGGETSQLVAANLDGRGPLDLAVSNGFDNRVSVLLNASRISRDANANGVPDECDIAVARSLDCNANRVPDEADLMPVVSFSPRRFGMARSPFGYDVQLAQVDLQHDGDMDIIAANTFEQEGLMYHFNRGDGTFGANEDPAPSVPGFEWLDGVLANSVATADLDSNGLADLALIRNVVVETDTPQVQVFRHFTLPFSAGSEWSAPFNVTMDERLDRIEAHDLDGDGSHELIVTPYYSTGRIIVLRNDEGRFDQVGELAISELGTTPMEPPSSSVLADMDNDGLTDLIFSVQGASEISICKNTGTPFVYSPCAPFPAGESPVHVRAGDLDGDGLPDLVTANDYTGHVSILLNMSDMLLVPNTIHVSDPTELDLGDYARIYPKGLVLDDLDGDSDLDIATANWFSDNVSVLINDSRGAFSDPYIFPAGFRPEAMLATDVDQDEALDLVVGNGNGELTVLINRSRPAIADDTDGDGRPDVCGPE